LITTKVFSTGDFGKWRHLPLRQPDRPVWRRGDYRRDDYWGGHVLAAGGDVRRVVLLVSGGAGFTWFCMLHSGLMILEANLNYRIGSSFDTITKDLLGKGWNLVNGVSIAFVLYILTYAYISASGSILHHTFSEMSLNVPARRQGFGLRCWWRLSSG
jgi:hypothetical protein